MTREKTIKNLLTELTDMIDNGSQRDLDRADEISTSIIKLLEQEPYKELIEFRDKIISIMTTYKYDEEERIYYILEVIQSYPETNRLYNAYMGNFS